MLLPGCPCCGTCCCVGGTLLNTTGYRRIDGSMTASECADAGGTAISSRTGACAGASVIIQWCGMTLTVSVGEQFKQASTSFDPVGECGVNGKRLLVSDFLYGWTSRQGWKTECGRCVMRFDVAMTEYLTNSGCFDAPGRNYVESLYRIDWRQDCDIDGSGSPVINIELVYSTGTFRVCENAAPVCTLTLAP